MNLKTLSIPKLVGPSREQDRPRYHVVFRIDQQHYALPLDHVVRALRMVAFTPVPDAPPSVLGIINMAGQMLPVIDLRFIFEQASRRPEVQDFLLILEIGSQTAAIVVDEVLNVLEFAPEQVQAPPGTVSQSRFLRAAVRQDDVTILVLEASQLFPGSDARRGTRLIP